MKKVYDYETAMVDIRYRRKKKSPRKTQILKSATKHFSEKGFDETSIKDIVDDAKCSIHAVNYYYGSKAALWSEVICLLAEKHFQFAELLNPHLKEKVTAQSFNIMVHKLFLYAFSEKNIKFAFMVPGVVSHDYEPALITLYKKFEEIDKFFKSYLSNLCKDEELLHQVSHLIWNNICAITISYRVINGPKINLQKFEAQLIQWAYFTTQSACTILGIEDPGQLTPKQLDKIGTEIPQ
ncbi:MAG: TetR/AcrR family transcriptional regulator [Candidatus Cloacimonetes bacterium]|nr:TetR/AcrR family transcriptional regulator [Candidatus Cloacimonadota bacterium]